MNSAYLETLRALVFRSIMTETRLSERQVVQLKWSQIEDDEIVTIYKRRVKLSRELLSALSVLPHTNRYVFFGTSLAHRAESEAMLDLKRQFAEEDARRHEKPRHFLFNRYISLLTKG